jgi:hypothetical protein
LRHVDRQHSASRRVVDSDVDRLRLKVEISRPINNLEISKCRRFWRHAEVVCRLLQIDHIRRLVDSGSR